MCVIYKVEKRENKNGHTEEEKKRLMGIIYNIVYTYVQSEFAESLFGSVYDNNNNIQYIIIFNFLNRAGSLGRTLTPNYIYMTEPNYIIIIIVVKTYNLPRRDYDYYIIKTVRRKDNNFIVCCITTFYTFLESYP